MPGVITATSGFVHRISHAAAVNTSSTARRGIQRRATTLPTESRTMLETVDYSPPEWASKLQQHAPKQRIVLGHLPTPVHAFHVPGLPDDVEMFVKRDDLTGMELSGNKVRKLEFLMAEAVAAVHDSVITIGGIQSNHCRATAVAARYLGLKCHLILRNKDINNDPKLIGNLLVSRMTGAHIHQVTIDTYRQHGSTGLLQRLEQQLRRDGCNPYVIPVGGSNACGTWGYIEAVRELLPDIERLGITDVAMACGSGGTTAGLALGLHMSGSGVRLHAYGVCDSPDYFYDYIDGLFRDLGATRDAVGTDARGIFRVVDAKGAGYAMSRESELETMRDVALASGIVLDPVYSGKAMHSMLQEMHANADAWRGRKVLFVHTGGLLGMYDKVDQLQLLVSAMDNVQPMKLD